MNRAGSLRGHVARNTTGKRKLAEQLAHAVFGLLDAGIHLGIRAVEPRVRDHPRPTVSGPCNIERRDLALSDDSIEMGVDEVEARRRSPVAEQSRFDVLSHERLAEQRIVNQIDLADRQVVRGPPPRIEVR